MNRNQQCILTIYEEGSFSKAAEKLFVSQPALSIIVKKTEDELGVPIFNRSTKPIKLTEAGECYVSFIKKLHVLETELEEQLNGLRERDEGTLTIGGSNFFCSYQFPEVFQQFKAKYPKYKIALTEGNPLYLSQQLLNSELELVVGVEHLDPKVYNREFWKQEYIVLGVSAADPINEVLADSRLSFEDISSGKYLELDCPAVSMAHFAKKDFYFMNRGNDSYNRCMSMCRNAGFKPNVIMYLDQMMTIYSAVKSGNGCAFLRADIMRHSEPTEKLCFYKIDDSLASRDIYVYYKKSAPLSMAAKQLVKFLQEENSLG